MDKGDSTIVLAFPAEVDGNEPTHKKPGILGTPGRRCIFSFIFFLLAAIGILLFLGFFLGWTKPKQEPKPTPSPTPTPTPTSCVGSEGPFKLAAVASDAEICSDIGSDIMKKKNGSAVDAAIAALLCNGLANFHSTGIGGGFFMTLFIKSENKVVTLDSREVAPAAATENMFVNDRRGSRFGGKAVAVPAEIAGFRAAHDRYGKVPWKELFEPTIKLCNEGVPILPDVYYAMDNQKVNIKANPLLKAMLIDPKTDEPYKVGHKVKHPNLAKTLRTIADEGADAYYNGSLSQTIVDEITYAGGIITLNDLKNYKPSWPSPVQTTLGGKLKMYSLPPPSSGAILMYILNILNGYNFKPADLKTHPARTYHRIIEAFKFAYARRAELGDQAFVNVTEIVHNLTSTAFADEARSRINDTRTYNASYYGDVTGKQNKQGTSHVSLVAPNGDAISVTSTINYFFGSQVLGNKTGILYNNQMDDFSTPNTSNAYGFPASKENFIQPGKRPMSSMSPTIVLDEKKSFKLAIGASGGSKIISSVAYVTTLVLMFDESIKMAIDAIRIHHQWLPNVVVYDKGFSASAVEALKKMGHVTTEYTGRGAVVEGVLKKDGKLYAYADARKFGCAAGFK